MSTTAKPAVVLEIGSKYVRAGFAGEAAPRCVYDSPLGALGDAAALGRDAWRGALDACLGDVFARGLLGPRGVALLLENPTAPRELREALVDGVLLAGARSVAFCPGLAAAAASQTALVVDVGACESRAVAVVRGRLLAHTLVVARVGADAVAARLGDLGATGAAAARADLAARACFARRRNGADAPGPALAFRDGAGAAPWAARRAAADALFDADAESEEAGLGALVLDCLGRAALELRAPLAANVLPVGGGAALPGFDARLLDELRALDGRLDFAVAYSPFPRCDAAWVGGSLLAAAAAPGALPGLSAADLDAAGLPDVFAVAGTGAVVAT